jgi:glutathione peroxidase
MADWRLALIHRRRLLKLFLLTASTFAAVAGLAGRQAAYATINPGRQKRTTMSAHDFDFAAIEGGALPLKAWKGKPILVVNTASFCGFTPQYADLEKLWGRYKDRGLVVLGVPSNDFGQQEPGSAKEIKAFCETYEVSFPLTEKQKVIGADAHPFYRWIAAELGDAGVPRWNFHKYLIDAQGDLAGAWPSRVTPLSPEVTEAVEQALKR